MMEAETELDWVQMADWTDEEVHYYLMGPFDGGIPGLVRRIRRILDVSQRGLAAILGASQSVVARWETGRTSPRAAVLFRLLELAGLRVDVRDVDSGEQVGPMRDDGARDRGGRRYPAHVDLTVNGWRCPREVQSTADVLMWRRRSRERQDPAIRFRTCPHFRRIFRRIDGTPDDHPAHDQLVAEAVHLDEIREQHRRKILEAAPWMRPPAGWLTA